MGADMTADEIVIEVELPKGAVTVSADYERAAPADATVVIAHGAGAGYRHPFMTGFSAGLVDAGFATLRFAFPYAQAGRRMPGPAAHAVATWSAAVATARELAPTGESIVACGKSYGGRMASTADAEGVIDVDALLYLGYPLHPPGDPDRLRVAHLPDVRAPQIFVSGRADPFVLPAEQLEAAVGSCVAADGRPGLLLWVDGNHSFEVKGHKRPADEIGRSLAGVVAPLVRSALDGSGSG